MTPEYENILFFIYGIWAINSLIAKKFNKRNFQNYYYSMAACTKAFILMVASMSVMIFAFRLFRFSRLHIFGTFFFLILFESVIYYLYFIFKFVRNVNGDIESPEEIASFLQQKKLHIEEKKSQEKILNPSFMKFIIDNFLESYPTLLKFIKDYVNLSKIRDNEIAILSSQDTFNIEVLGNKSLKLFINLYKLNDIRWINRYFLEVHKKLINGGYFIGRAVTIQEHKKRFFKKYPKYYAEFFYILNFIFYRVFPKLPELKKLYFTLTKGKNRLISKAEVLGRLYFCGFNVIGEQEIGDSLFFIAQKVKTPSIDQSPSYGPIIKLKRIGLNGNIIFIYKFRTMYPYSEYLQKYIYEHHKLKRGGKIKDDFRITEWGKFMRRYWLDELPMIYNWIRGDIKLFGVRPLSMHYLSLYNKQLREMRKKIKPGLIPPFYADLPIKFKDIVESEMRYIQAYLKNPIKTQCVYFFKTLNNILIKGARSR
ncbi:MAG: sugar transferase [Candidatus Helarchaeota archaeon]